MRTTKESANNIPLTILYKKTSLNKEIPKYQLVLYDFNNEIIEMERLHRYLAHLWNTNEESNEFNKQDYLLYSIPTEKYLIQCKQ